MLIFRNLWPRYLYNSDCFTDYRNRPQATFAALDSTGYCKYHAVAMGTTKPMPDSDGDCNRWHASTKRGTKPMHSSPVNGFHLTHTPTQSRFRWCKSSLTRSSCSPAPFGIARSTHPGQEDWHCKLFLTINGPNTTCPTPAPQTPRAKTTTTAIPPPQYSHATVI